MPTKSDLILLGISAACIAVVAITSNLAVDVIAGLLLAVYLPGAALVSAIGSRRRLPDVVERQLWILGASFGLTALGGIVLNLSGGLTRSSWLVWIGAEVVFFIALKTQVSRRGGQSNSDTLVPSADGDEPSISDGGPTGGRSDQIDAYHWMRISLRQLLLLLSAGAICVAAGILSIHSNAVTTRESFVQAWVLPRPFEEVFSTSVQLGVGNHLGGRHTFLVHVTVGKEHVKIFSVSLANGASWTHVITRRPGERVESSVSISLRPSVVLTRAYLAAPVTSAHHRHR